MQTKDDLYPLLGYKSSHRRPGRNEAEHLAGCLGQCSSLESLSEDVINKNSPSGHAKTVLT
jgi:hypothetical protein